MITNYRTQKKNYTESVGALGGVPILYTIYNFIHQTRSSLFSLELYI